MKYIEFINQTIRQHVIEHDDLFIFGQNIAAGSCLSGLTRGLKVKEGSLVVNTPNCENTLCGIGFGAMMNGVNAIFFMKQLDFLLLGIDHLVNTYNIIRRSAPKASFTIFPVIVDSGYEGPQASLNNLADFCSIARIPGFTLTNACDAQAIMAAHLVSPGFRIITASQRLFKTEIIDTKALFMNPARTVFQYSDGPAATIVCFNFSFPQGMELNERFKQKGLKASLFTINAATPTDWEQVIANVKTTKNLVLIEDSKSENAPWQSFLIDVLEQVKLENKIIIRRDMSGYYPRPHADQVIVDYDAVINRFLPSQAMR